MLTVLLATYNGADTLPEVLNAYRRLESPSGGWRLVIVDNGSTDATPAIVRDFAAQLPLTYHFEATPGKNAALNSGLRLVTGDLVVLTDDDAVPWPDWLRHLRAAADAEAGFSLFGGRIIPRWCRPPEPWILQFVPLPLTFAISPPLEPGPVPRCWVFGPNMAVRTAIFEAGYRFDPTIGPRGSNYAQGSEDEFTRRLEHAGYKAWHCKDAVVEHIIQPHQLTRTWILRRARRFARGQYRLEAAKPRWPVLPGVGVPITFPLHLVRQSARLIKARLLAGPEALFREQWRWNYLLGVGEEARLMHRASRQR